MHSDIIRLIQSFDERIHYIFREFDNVLIALSASAESTLLLHLTYKIWKEHYRNRRVCVFNIDTEIAHSYSVLHLMESFETIKNEMEPVWIMLPAKIKHSLFGKKSSLLAWDDSIDKLLRPIPDLPYALSINSNTSIPYRHGMPANMLASSFLKWYKRDAGGGRTVCIDGARLGEAHNRDKLLFSGKRYRGCEWIAMRTSGIWNASPLFDWSLSHVWKTISELNLKYNEIYDLLYKRGDDLEGFRITPVLDLEAYKEIRRFAELDGVIWDDLCRRIKGIELFSTYSDPRPLFESTNKSDTMENQYEKSCI